jgi:hypothetical protein
MSAEDTELQPALIGRGLAFFQRGAGLFDVRVSVRESRVAYGRLSDHGPIANKNPAPAPTESGFRVVGGPAKPAFSCPPSPVPRGPLLCPLSQQPDKEEVSTWLR